jgi:hypothetical protein
MTDSNSRFKKINFFEGHTEWWVSIEGPMTKPLDRKHKPRISSTEFEWSMPVSGHWVASRHRRELIEWKISERRQKHHIHRYEPPVVDK